MKDLDDIFDTPIKTAQTSDEATMLKLIKSQVQQLIDEAYRKGYNDNVRDCYCDSPGATEGVLPHHHLADNGKSHNIRPDVKELGL